MVYNSTCRFYRMLRHNVIHVAARVILVSVAVRKRLNLNRMRLTKTYVYLYIMTSSQNDMFIDNRGITHHDIIAKRYVY